MVDAWDGLARCFVLAVQNLRDPFNGATIFGHRPDTKKPPADGMSEAVDIYLI
jgi:hypothetical protein